MRGFGLKAYYFNKVRSLFAGFQTKTNYQGGFVPLNFKKMTDQEYKSKYAKLEEDFRLAKVKLARECVNENAIYKVGDILEGYNGIIIVERIRIYMTFSTDVPEPSYFGTQLTKKLKPYKNTFTMSISQSNVIKKL